jgi:hypothetical protein
MPSRGQPWLAPPLSSAAARRDAVIHSPWGRVVKAKFRFQRAELPAARKKLHPAARKAGVGGGGEVK